VWQISPPYYFHWMKPFITLIGQTAEAQAQKEGD